MEKLRANHWRDTQGKLLKDGLKPRSVNHVQTVLGTLFKQAVSDGVVKANPFANVKRLPLGDDAFEDHVLTDAEIAAFEKACDGERLGTFLCFILDHGLRHGEARNLKRADVFLDAPEGAYFVIRESKSGAGRRRIPLTAAWVERLRQHYRTVDDERSIAEERAVDLAKKTGELRARWTDHGYVFPSETGTKLSEQNVNKIKQRVLRKAGLCDPCTACGATGAINKVRCAACKGRGVIVWPIRVHDLRHTFVTDLIANGADPKAVQALASRSDPSVTMKIYAKSRESRQQEALERIAQARSEQRKQAARE